MAAGYLQSKKQVKSKDLQQIGSVHQTEEWSIGIVEYWNNGENKTTAGYSSWLRSTHHSSIPAFPQPRGILLNSVF
jgi:hypothetical protein